MASVKENPSVVIIGAGMTGLLLVIKLRELGITNITLLEKTHTIGGTWRENTYPGVACDVPSHAYTYSFEPNPEWSMHFPPGAEIYEYFKKVFYKYGIDHCTRFNEAVTSCVYNDSSHKWTVQSALGNSYEADLLFSATGILHQPAYPDIPGLQAFAGACFHTACWDHSVDLKGKRIGVIGTGSTAAQVIPSLVDMPGTDVTVFQRTAQWLVKMDDRRFSEDEKQRFKRQPWRMKVIRRLSALVYSLGTQALTGDSWLDKQIQKLMGWNARHYLQGAIVDPQLCAKLTPNYKFGCKRVVISAKYYDAIQQPNAHLVTDGIEKIEAGGVRTKDGKLHELDVLVLSTGFNPAAFMRPMEFIGKNGVSIEQAWAKKISAYRSMFLPDFPNFFLMLGPNSPIGNQSVIEISEHQTEYLLQLVKRWQRGELPVIQVKPEAMERWRNAIKQRMGKTVWVSGCNSWYLDADGDALAWPDSWRNWKAAMAVPDLGDFVSAGGDQGRAVNGNAGGGEPEALGAT